MFEAFLCGEFIEVGSGHEPLMFGITSPHGAREALLRVSAAPPDAVLRRLLVPRKALPRGLDPATAVDELLGDLPPDATVYTFDVPADALATLAASLARVAPGARVYDIAPSLGVVFPRMGEASLSALATVLGAPAPSSRRPDALSATLAECFPGLVDAFAHDLPPELIEECGRLGDSLGWPRAPAFAAVVEATRASGRPRGDLHELLLTHQRPTRPQRPVEGVRLTDESVSAVLGANGALAKVLPGYESRPRQLARCLDVGASIRDDEVLMVEAGTGVGKSLAYLTPLVLHVLETGERAIVSTATKALQDQLTEHDAPLLLRALGRQVRVEPIKGRANYLCCRKLWEAYSGARGTVLAEDHAARLPIVSWAVRSETLDLSEFPCDELSPTGQWLRKLTAEADSCSQLACPDRRGCALVRLRARAQASDIAVINHALYFAGREAGSLPDFQRIVFDEAHTLEDIATEHYGASLSGPELERLLLRVRHTDHEPGALDLARALIESCVPPPEGCEGLWAEADERAAQLFDETRILQARCESLVKALDPNGATPRVRLAEESFAGAQGKALRDATDGLCEDLRALGSALDLLAEALEDAVDPSAQAERLAQVLRELRLGADALADWADTAQRLVYLDWGDRVFYTERSRGAAILHAAPIDIGPYLAKGAFQPNRTVVLTSATLSVDGAMRYFVDRLGLAEVSERLRCVTYPSEFDFRRQAMAVVPTDMPDPRDEDWLGEIARAVTAVVLASRGRALVLFTSRQHLEAVHEACLPALRAAGLPVYCQTRAASTGRLKDVFAEDVDSVLFATRTFFEGVDVPGESLQCVVLTRLPFAVPTDPIIESRCERVARRGGNPMEDYYIPKAIVTFRQAFGRLIRTRTDRGCVAILDPRIVRKRYGKRFLDALPDCAVARRPMDEAAEYVRDWFAAR